MPNLTPTDKLTSKQLTTLYKNIDQLLSVSEQEIKSDVERYMSAQYAPNTKKAYFNNWVMFCAYCKEVGVDFLPASCSTVVRYITVLAKFKATSTVTQHVAAIKAAHELSNHDSPTLHKAVRTLIEGIKREKGINQKQALPISKDLLENTILDFEKNEREKAKLSTWKRNKAIILLSWWGCFRESELANLNLDDIRLEENGITVTLTKSKGDKNKEGSFKFIPMLKKTPNLCPVIALENWVAWADIQKGAIFKEIKSKTTKGETKDTILKDRLIAESVYYAVVKLFGKQYSSHSLRVGFAVEAYEKGASTDTIQRAGNWKNPKMVDRYTKQAKVRLRNAASVLID